MGTSSIEVVLDDANITIIATVELDNGTAIDLDDVIIETDYTYSVAAKVSDLRQGTIDALFELAEAGYQAELDEDADAVGQDWG